MYYKMRIGTYAVFNGITFILFNNFPDSNEWILSGYVSDFLLIHKEKSLIKRFFLHEEELNHPLITPELLENADSKEYECGHLPISPDLLENAFSTEYYCEYNGDVLKCAYSEKERTFSLLLGENEELCRRYGIGKVYDRYIASGGNECFNDLWIVVPEDTVLDVWEQRIPIDGFPFKGPEKVYVRKNGAWLR